VCPRSPSRSDLGSSLVAENGIAVNGIAVNGIAVNGIAVNGIAADGTLSNGLGPGAGSSGLAVNGLTQAALAAPEFAWWFARSPEYASMVMSYLVRCSLRAESTLAYEHEGASYAWTGNLGVAPRWGAGGTIPEEEQELVSACLAAHVNGLGQHVTISVRGHLAAGDPIPLAPGEEENWLHRESCFFGNIFDGTGVWTALEYDLLDAGISTPRGCSAEFGVPQSCPPMMQAGYCADLCTSGPDGVTWMSCAVDGRPFRPLQVYLQPSDVYWCGDEVCQPVTENEDNCATDCAAPPPAEEPPPAKETDSGTDSPPPEGEAP
jgi:hypothetical protein